MLSRLRRDIRGQEQELLADRHRLQSMGTAFARGLRRRLTSPMALVGAFAGGVGAGLLQTRQPTVRHLTTAGKLTLFKIWNTTDHYVRLLVGTALLPFLVRKVKATLDAPPPAAAPTRAG